MNTCIVADFKRNLYLSLLLGRGTTQMIPYCLMRVSILQLHGEIMWYNSSPLGDSAARASFSGKKDLWGVGSCVMILWTEEIHLTTWGWDIIYLPLTPNYPVLNVRWVKLTLFHGKDVIHHPTLKQPWIQMADGNQAPAANRTFRERIHLSVPKIHVFFATKKPNKKIQWNPSNMLHFQVSSN